MPTILVTGENDFRCRTKLNEIISLHKKTSSAESVHKIDGLETDSGSIASLLGTQSLFSPGKQLIVIIRPAKNKPVSEALAGLLDAVPSDTTLVIYEPRIDKRSKLYKDVKKNGQVEEFGQLDENLLVLWSEEYCRGQGSSITKSAARDIVRRLKGDQARLASELDKLISYDDEITQDSVELLVEDTPEDNIFALLEIVVAGNKKKAIMKYRELRRAQVDPFYILSMICWQLNNMLLVKAASRRNDHEIASKAKMSPFVVQKTRHNIRQITLSELLKMSETALASETSLKSVSANPDHILEQLIIKL